MHIITSLQLAHAVNAFYFFYNTATCICCVSDRKTKASFFFSSSFFFLRRRVFSCRVIKFILILVGISQEQH